jgi:hypothetical protein
MTGTGHLRRIGWRAGLANSPAPGETGLTEPTGRRFRNWTPCPGAAPRRLDTLGYEAADMDDARAPTALAPDGSQRGNPRHCCAGRELAG